MSTSSHLVIDFSDSQQLELQFDMKLVALVDWDSQDEVQKIHSVERADNDNAFAR